MNSSLLMRILGWAIPLVCMLAASGAVYGQFKRGNEARDADAKVLARIDSQEKLLQQIKDQPTQNVILAADPAPQEETAFVARLKELAANTGVKIQRLSTTVQSAPVDATTLSDVTAIKSTLELDGEYLQVREFVSGITRGPRLLVLSDASWKLEKSGTRLTVTITRYVKASAVQTSDSPQDAVKDSS